MPGELSVDNASYLAQSSPSSGCADGGARKTWVDRRAGGASSGHQPVVRHVRPWDCSAAKFNAAPGYEAALHAETCNYRDVIAIAEKFLGPILDRRAESHGSALLHVQRPGHSRPDTPRERLTGCAFGGSGSSTHSR